MRLELTRRADYAVRAMLQLAQDYPALTSAPRIADAMNIPPRFISQIMGDLVSGGLATARTGRKGGYALARPAAAISILDVVEAVEGDARRRTCVLRGIPCAKDGHCAVHGVFAAAQDALLERLAAATLASVINEFTTGPIVRPTT